MEVWIREEIKSFWVPSLAGYARDSPVSDRVLLHKMELAASGKCSLYKTSLAGNDRKREAKMKKVDQEETTSAGTRYKCSPNRERLIHQGDG